MGLAPARRYAAATTFDPRRQQDAVGWIPWVGWLSPQIMIFYFFGERIFHSDVFNFADWLWGSLPFFRAM